MRILIAFVCMGFLGTVATVLAVVQVLARAWPALVVVLLAVIVTARLRNRRAHRVGAPVATLPAASTVTGGPLASTSQPTSAHPTAWVLVPVWMNAQGQASRQHPVIDGDVIMGDGRHG
ncbi:hypothetical protein [Mycobacterium sp. 1465703.0]|uniref:hypothetical protein n=1 Tax=Mycobacterium sp. 1465703.0 TaxID=1834078 RepID=UPI00080014E8|nr:hypothetical protein [Mycobacterium sp. 1465703.0]OBJ10580.1 hypothetical protein A5625_11095 [Mycobacterium sp. 1465703.0]